MTLSSSPTSTAVIPMRQRKAHRKSRLGCGNCKLRSVKCDESKPECGRCLASGFRCSYARAAPELQLANTPGVFKIQLNVGPPRAGTGAEAEGGLLDEQQQQLRLPDPACGLQEAVFLPVATPLQGQSWSYELRSADRAALTRFLERTCYTVGVKRLRNKYKQQTTILASSNPFLIHGYLMLTYLHDAHLSTVESSTPSHRTALAFHWYHATVLFQRLLACPPSTLQSAQRDALWAASILLGAASFAHVEALDPHGVWPLRAGNDPTDLDWLRLSEGKKAVWPVADPTRPESGFHFVVRDAVTWRLPQPEVPIPAGGLPEPFFALLGLDDPASSPATNPYHGHASLLAQLLPDPVNDDNLVSFITFVSQPDRRFRRLLEAKDHRALLLLAWWYAGVAAPTQWWMHRRAVIEGAALCIYLARNSDDPRVHELLDYPREAFRVAAQGMKIVRQRLDDEFLRDITA